MRKRLGLFESELHLQDDNYSFEEKDGNIVQIEIFENEYSDLCIDGNKLIEVIHVYKHLRTLEISATECVIDDISKLCDLKELEYFHLECATNISDLSAFKDLANIKSISIPDAQVSDLSPLKDLTGLVSLAFYNNKIRDINCLENLKGLQNLNVAQNEIEDVSVLVNCKDLRSLIVSENKISDLSAIRSLCNLTNLYVGDNKITNLDFLQDSSGLRYFNFDTNQVVVCDAISNHKELVQLSFKNNQIGNIECLNNLKNITYLNISGNPIKDFSPVWALTAIGFLNASAVPIRDFESFEKLTELRHLYLNGCGVHEVSFLEKNIKMETLSLNDNSIDDVSSLSLLTRIKNLSLKNNKLAHVFPLYLFYDLNELDLRENAFGNSLYVKYAGYRGVEPNYEKALTFDKLSLLIGEYYLSQKEYDKALAFCYLEWPVRNQLVIYSKKFIETDAAEVYYLKYYFSKCSQAINFIKNQGEEQIEDVVEKIKDKIASLLIPEKSDFLYCLENSHGYPYSLFQEFNEYFEANPSASKNREVLYFLGKNLCRRASLLQSLSIYKELKNANHPLGFKLYKMHRNCLDKQFAYTESERKEHDKFRFLLDKIEEAEIPHFDYMGYISVNYSSSRYYPPIKKESYHPGEEEVRKIMGFSERFQIVFILLIVFGCFLGLLYVFYLMLTFP